jgi:hypothetical protein
MSVALKILVVPQEPQELARPWDLLEIPRGLLLLEPLTYTEPTSLYEVLESTTVLEEEC